MNTSGPLALFISAAILCSASGQEPAATVEEPVKPTKEELLQALFEAQGLPALEATIKTARASGVSEQAILEARFVYLVDQGNNAAIGAIAPELETFAPNFKVAESAIFTVKEEFLAIIEYAHALTALEIDDHESFKKHIKEAFWLSPNQAAAFAPHIERLRLQEAMANLKIDFQLRLTTQEDNKALTLAEVSGGADYVLLHFWSPWSEECAAFLGDFIATSNELAKNGIAVVSVFAESAPDAAPDAAEFLASVKEQTACQWVNDNPDQPLARELRLANVPTFALIHKDGRVLFNGHPAEGDLWKQLKIASPKIIRPEVAPAPSPPIEAPNP
jgi:thiol-disulfide isomerase/thioredoxin